MSGKPSTGFSALEGLMACALGVSPVAEVFVAGQHRLAFVLAAQIGLDGVIVHVVRAHPTLAARAFGNGGDFDHHFVAIFFANFVAIPGADPSERRFAFRRSVGIGRIGRERSVVEIELPRQRRNDAQSGLAAGRAIQRGGHDGGAGG